jgi:hypothetical protein
MRKAEALRLKPGDRMIWGHSKWTAENDRAGSRRRGAMQDRREHGERRLSADSV